MNIIGKFRIWIENTCLSYDEDLWSQSSHRKKYTTINKDIHLYKGAANFQLINKIKR